MRLIDAYTIEYPLMESEHDDIWMHVAIDSAPTIEAVPIKAISEWLAGYAAPPLYAIDHVAALKNKVSIKTETERAEAWEYHWQHLIDCGLLQEDEHDPE